MNGKVVVVTGGARGIGHGIARCMKDAGATVVIADIDTRWGWKAASDIGTDFVAVDVRQFGDLCECMRRVAGKHGAVDVLIANAGKNNVCGTAGTSFSEWNEVINFNLSSVFYSVKASLDYMRDGGRIIAISSLVGVIGQQRSAAYAAAKAGINGYVRGLARELAPRNIAVNAIAPGDVMSDGYREYLDKNPGEYERVCDNIPLGRFATTMEIGMLALFLASEDGAFITGQTIVIDGGKSLGKW